MRGAGCGRSTSPSRSRSPWTSLVLALPLSHRTSKSLRALRRYPKNRADSALYLCCTPTRAHADGQASRVPRAAPGETTHHRAGRSRIGSGSIRGPSGATSRRCRSSGSRSRGSAESAAGTASARATGSRRSCSPTTRRSPSRSASRPRDGSACRAPRMRSRARSRRSTRPARRIAPARGGARGDARLHVEREAERSRDAATPCCSSPTPSDESGAVARRIVRSRATRRGVS